MIVEEGEGGIERCKDRRDLKIKDRYVNSCYKKVMSFIHETRDGHPSVL